MKKYIILFTSGLLLLLFGTSTYAQVDNEPTPDKKIFRKLENKPINTRSLDTDSTRGANRREEIKEKIDAKRRELIGRHFDRMIKRFEAAIERLEKLISRIEARLSKLKSLGQDTASLELQLTAASDKLTQAKKDLDGLKENSDFLSSEDPKTAFSSLKQKVGLVRDEIKGVHQALVRIVTQIKGLRVGNTKRVSPTGVPTVTPSPTI